MHDTRIVAEPEFGKSRGLGTDEWQGYCATCGAKTPTVTYSEARRWRSEHEDESERDR